MFSQKYLRISLQAALTGALCGLLALYVFVLRLLPNETPALGVGGFVLPILLSCLTTAFIQWRLILPQRATQDAVGDVVTTMRGAVPVCCYCNSVQTRSGWRTMDLTLLRKQNVPFEMIACPTCTAKHTKVKTPA